MKTLLIFILLFAPGLAAADTLIIRRLPVAEESGCGTGTFFSDTFTEGSNVNLDAHTPDTGTGWTGTDAGNGVLAIDAVNDHLRSTTGTGHAVITDDVDCDDYTVTASARTGSTGSNRVGPLTRWDEPNDSGYEGRVTGSGNWEIRRVDNGSATELTSGSVATLLGSFSVNTFYAIELRSEGSTHTIWINDTLADSVEDATYGSGKPGITVSGTNPRATSLTMEY